MAECMKCRRTLTGDEVGIYKRLVNRGAREFLCKTCLSAHFGCTESQIEEKIEHFRAMGCTLFAPAVPVASKRRE